MMYALFILAILLVGSAIAFSERTTLKSVFVALAGVAYLIGIATKWL